MQNVSTARARFIVSANRIATSLDNEMVTFTAYRIPTPTNNSALVAVHGSGSGHVLLHDVQAHRHRSHDGVGAFRRVADAEEDLPHLQVREERSRRREHRVPRQESPDVGSERLRHGGSFDGGEGEEIVEIGRDSSLHSLQRPSVDNHSEAAAAAARGSGSGFRSEKR